MSGGDFVLPKIGGGFVRGAFVRGTFVRGDFVLDSKNPMVR